jgi:hypothetical protein
MNSSGVNVSPTVPSAHGRLKRHPDETGRCLLQSGSRQGRAARYRHRRSRPPASRVPRHPAVQGVAAPGCAPGRERTRAPPMNLEPTRTSASRDRGPPLYRGRLHQQQRVVIVAVLFLTVVGSEALTRQPALGARRQLHYQPGDLLGRHRTVTHEPLDHRDGPGPATGVAPRGRPATQEAIVRMATASTPRARSGLRASSQACWTEPIGVSPALPNEDEVDRVPHVLCADATRVSTGPSTWRRSSPSTNSMRLRRLES